MNSKDHKIHIKQDDDRGYDIWWGTENANPISTWISAYVEAKPPYKATVSCQLLDSNNIDEYRRSNFKKLDNAVSWCLNTMSERIKQISVEICKTKINIKENNVEQHAEKNIKRSKK